MPTIRHHGPRALEVVVQDGFVSATSDDAPVEYRQVDRFTLTQGESRHVHGRHMRRVLTAETDGDDT